MAPDRLRRDLEQLDTNLFGDVGLLDHRPDLAKPEQMLSRQERDSDLAKRVDRAVNDHDQQQASRPRPQ